MMRADMAKVIVERPRYPGNSKPKGYERRLRDYGEDGPPRCEGMKVRWKAGPKGLNEHLGPLRRYLDKQVGRPWDKVYSEVCANIDRNNAVQDHVRDHVDQYVTTQVIEIDGVPCVGAPGWSYGQPLHRFHYRYWYVCPRTGLLRRNKTQSRKRPLPPEKETPPNYIRVSATQQCRFFDNAWHLVTLKLLPGLHQYGYCRGVDVLLKKHVSKITPGEAREKYGSAVYAVSVRRLTRQEERQYPIPFQWWS